ncbi:MAG: 2-C-methyl-D-erythritol 4-phosphate cytidylyltransferase [Halioglobus sp.]
MSSSARCWAVVPAAGIGQRMTGDVPKQYRQIAGRSILEHSLHALLGCDRIEGICVALHPEDEHAAQIALLADAGIMTTRGAAERSGSVLAGLNALTCAEEDDWVLVHDAARPCLRSEDVTRLIEQVLVARCGGILAESVVDTVKRADADGCVVETLNRQRLWLAQTPQMFRLGELRAALEAAAASMTAITDEASAMERAGHPVLIVPCGSHNLKVTVASDLALAGYYLGADD